MRTFEQYLNELHAKDRPQVLDDDMPDDFNNWLDQFDATAMMGLAESYGEQCSKENLQELADVGAMIIEGERKRVGEAGKVS